MATSTREVVTSVSRAPIHRFGKPVCDEIVLLAGLGVQGDAHAGATVRHRSRVATDPTQPNLRQVHLIHAELHDELRDHGFDVAAGQLGENITTRGLDLLALPRGTLLRFGPSGAGSGEGDGGRGGDPGGVATVQVTGLRNPCQQISAFRPGLLRHVARRDTHGDVVRRAGVMGVVLRGGTVRPGDRIVVELPAGAPLPLAPV